MAPNEEIISYTIDYSSGTMYAIVGRFSPDRKVISNRLVNVGRQGYDMLMARNPAWAPGKPEGNFRKEDMVVAINLIENQQT
jgi:hypothetical protein